LIVAVRLIYIYAGRPIPLSELIGALGVLLLSISFIWMRLVRLHPALAVAVPCIGSGVVAFVLWMTKNRALALANGFLSVWYAVDWAKRVRNRKRRRFNGSSDHPKEI